MIAHIHGVVAEKIETALIVDVHGVGYEVQVAASDFDEAHLGSDIKLHTYHHIREQSQELFGFSHLSAKRLFELLITVQGVGPKAALAILSVGSAEQVRSAIAMGDSAYIQSANGIGKRIADRVVVDLKDKVGAPGAASPLTMARTHQSDDALDALMALGYNLRQATEALTGIDITLPTEKRIHEALKGMQR